MTRAMSRRIGVAGSCSECLGAVQGALSRGQSPCMSLRFEVHRPAGQTAASQHSPVRYQAALRATVGPGRAPAAVRRSWGPKEHLVNASGILAGSTLSMHRVIPPLGSIAIKSADRVRVDLGRGPDRTAAEAHGDGRRTRAEVQQNARGRVAHSIEMLLRGGPAGGPASPRSNPARSAPGGLPARAVHSNSPRRTRGSHHRGAGCPRLAPEGSRRRCMHATASAVRPQLLKTPRLAAEPHLQRFSLDNDGGGDVWDRRQSTRVDNCRTGHHAGDLDHHCGDAAAIRIELCRRLQRRHAGIR